MNVQDIYIVNFYHVYYLTGQSQLIRFVMKQRIIRDVDLMKVYIGTDQLKTYRLSVGNKVYVVAFSGQLKSKFGSNDATTPKSWITYYAYFHFNL